MMISQALRFLDTYVRNKDVLEVGSGIGTFCNEAYKTAREVVAIDVENKASNPLPNPVFLAIYISPYFICFAFSLASSAFKNSFANFS